MTFYVKKNNADSTVNDNPLAAGAVTLNVTATEGSNFPSSFPFLITIWDKTNYPNPKDDSGMEISRCTGRTSDALTIVRGQEGTSDVEHSQNETVSMLVTAGLLDDATYGIEGNINTHTNAANPHSGSAVSGSNSDITEITGLTTDLTVAQGGTGQSTEQAAIDTLSAVSGATNEHVLTKDTATGNATWKVAAGGFSDPMTTRGDIIIKNAVNTTTRLGIGTNGQVLTSDGTDIAWDTGSTPDDTAYDATTWNTNTDAATKNAIRDKIETMDTVIGLNTAKTTNATHTGEVTGATALTITTDAVTYDKMQDTSATDKLLGRSTVGAGTVEEIACTAAGRAILDDIDANAQRTTLGVDVAGTDNSTNVTLAVSATTGGLSLSTQEIGYRAATNAQTGYTTAAHIQAIEANTAKNTNVSTALSVGTVGINTVAITSDGGADDVTLPAATVTTAGVLTTAKWSEIVTNNAKVTNATHTGDVTGATALTIGADKVLDSHINWGTGATQVSAVDILIADVGVKIIATEVEGALQENRTAIDLNTAKTTNATHTGNVTGATELTIANDAVTYAKMQNVVADERILGNITAADSIVAELTAAQVLTMIGVTSGADVTGSNAPQAHEASHKSGGSDEILLDEFGTPTDIITNNASTTYHGLLKKLDNNSSNFMNGQGNWAAPAGGGSQTVNLFLPAEAAYLPATNSALLTEVAGATVYGGYSTLDFDDSTDEHAVFRIPVPDYDGNNMTIKFRWFAAAIAGDVIWQIESIGVANSEEIIAAVVGDSATVAAATVDGTTLDLNVTTHTTYNPAGVAADDFMVLEITRDADNAADTMSGDAKLLSVEVEYTRA